MAEMNFLGTPAFYPPKEFTGKAEHFEEFSYKLRAYMNLLNPGYSHIFRSIEADPTQVIQDEDFHEVQQVRAEDCTVTQVVVTETKIAVLASVLQNVLTTPCAGDGSTLLRRSITMDGFGSWRNQIVTNDIYIYTYCGPDFEYDRNHTDASAAQRRHYRLVPTSTEHYS